LTALLLLTLFSCGVRGFLKKPAIPAQQQQDSEALTAVYGHGRDGDWLLIRGYKLVDDGVSTITSSPFSHAAILDMSRELVIESDNTGVHTTSLPDFMKTAHRLLVIRPVWARRGAAKKALATARSCIGKPYDFSGLIGIDVPESYYCSELAVKIYKPFFRKKDVLPPVIAPSELIRYGKILYDSGERELVPE
jgi:hypothetical protein